MLNWLAIYKGWHVPLLTSLTAENNILLEYINSNVLILLMMMMKSESESVIELMNLTSRNIFISILLGDEY